MAALTALCNNQWTLQMNKEFEKRRNLLWDGLSALEKIKPIKPQGTFYMLCNINNCGLTSIDFSSKLLEKYLVSTIPADSFGASGFIRLSFAASQQEIIKGIERIQAFVKQL
jgi:aspartate aminotransferase